MKITKQWKDQIDELVLYAENDPELAEGLKWLDKTQRYPPEMDIYERVMRVLQIADADQRAKEWMGKRNNK